MTMSNYPNGFENGVLIQDMPVLPPAPGKVFWVGNNATLLTNEKSASDGNKGTFLQPFSTVDYAIGQCAANRGDRIYVRPGYTQTVTATSGIDIDVAGVQVIGLGVGSKRPTITFTTATAADIQLAAANAMIHNFLFVNGIDSQVAMIDVAGDDTEISHCEFREGASTTGLTFITVGAADGDSDRCYIHNCKFYSNGAGNYDAAISIAKDMNGVVIEKCDFVGDYDFACIDVPSGGNAQVNLTIRDCYLSNEQSGQHAIQINGTGNSGVIANCQCRTDDYTAVIDAGGLEVFNCTWSAGADQSGSCDAMATPANYFTVAASFSQTTWSSVTTHEVATITGLCKVSVIPEVSTSLIANTAASAGSLALGFADSTTELIAATTIAGASVFNALDLWTSKATTQNQAAMWTEIKDDLTAISNGSDLGYTVGAAKPKSGVITFHIWWTPLEDGAKVVAGAGGTL